MREGRPSNDYLCLEDQSLNPFLPFEVRTMIKAKLLKQSLRIF